MPFYCLYCKRESENKGTGGSISDYVMYFGIDFLKGSTICVSVDKNGKKTVPAEIMKLIQAQDPSSQINTVQYELWELESSKLDKGE